MNKNLNLFCTFLRLGELRLFQNKKILKGATCVEAEKAHRSEIHAGVLGLIWAPPMESYWMGDLSKKKKKPTEK